METTLVLHLDELISRTVCSAALLRTGCAGR
jgi:hypothetical protein